MAPAAWTNHPFALSSVRPRRFSPSTLSTTPRQRTPRAGTGWYQDLQRTLNYIQESNPPNTLQWISEQGRSKHGQTRCYKAKLSNGDSLKVRVYFIDDRDSSSRILAWLDSGREELRSVDIEGVD